MLPPLVGLLLCGCYIVFVLHNGECPMIGKDKRSVLGMVFGPNG